MCEAWLCLRSSSRTSPRLSHGILTTAAEAGVITDSFKIRSQCVASAAWELAIQATFPVSASQVLLLPQAWLDSCLKILEPSRVWWCLPVILLFWGWGRMVNVSLGYPKVLGQWGQHGETASQTISEWVNEWIYEQTRENWSRPSKSHAHAASVDMGLKPHWLWRLSSATMPTCNQGLRNWPGYSNSPNPRPEPFSSGKSFLWSFIQSINLLF